MKALRVFIVDDFKGVREMMKVLMSSFGHQVVLEAGSLEEGIEKAKKVLDFGVDAAIIDARLNTGEHDGLAVHETIKKVDSRVGTISLSMNRQNWGDDQLEKGDPIEALEGALTKIAEKRGKL